MDTQDLVLDRFPHAEARQEPAIYRHGDASPLHEGHWSIVAGPDPDAAELGRGRSESVAWSDAAEQIQIGRLAA